MSHTYRALLINPWIYDVAAHDFWTKPLGLLYLAALLERAGVHVDLLDCLDRYDQELQDLPGVNVPKGKKRGTGKYVREPLVIPKPFQKITDRRFSRYGFPLKLVQQKLSRLQKPDVILITSTMIYWYPAVVDMVTLCRKYFPNIPVILGGIYATLCPEHAKRVTGGDWVVSGEGEQQLFSIIRNFYPHFPGKNPKDDLDDYPFPAYHLYHTVGSLPILTSRGCPFRCSFCASHLLSPRFRRRSPENVVEELRYFSRKKHVRHFAFYDDALLVDPHHHIEPILQMMIDSNLRLKLHTPNGLHPRYIDERLAKLMVQAGFETIRLSFETAAPSQEPSLDQKVKPDHLINAIDVLERAGFPRKEIEVYILSGLPGQEINETIEDMLLVHGFGVKIRLAQFSPIPGTEDWQKAVELGMDNHLDPLLTNSSIFSRQWGEAYYNMQQRLHQFSKILNYAIDLNIPLSGNESWIKKENLEKLWIPHEQ